MDYSLGPVWVFNRCPPFLFSKMINPNEPGDIHRHTMEDILSTRFAQIFVDNI
jgi:hypothetical protein